MVLEFTVANAPRLGGSRFQVINNQSAAAITPATILGSNLVAWFRADLGTWQNSGLTTPAVANGDPVGGWVDQSGNGHNILQATSAARPTLELSDLNGYPALRFNGSSDFLQSASFTAIAHTTVIVVMRPTVVTSQSSFFDGLSGSNRNALLVGNVSGYYTWFAGTVVQGPAATANAWAILNATFNGASSLFHANGGSDVSGSVGTQSLGGITVGSNYTDSNYCSCDIAEVIVASGAQSNTVRAQLDSYCDARYAVY